MSSNMEFTNTELDNRALIIKMLQYEDSLILGPVGKEIYEDNSFEHYSSHEAMYIIHRITLDYFGFRTKDEDVQNYRKIFSKYYESPTKYDAEVLQSVVYMRENKLVYNANKDFNPGDIFEDVQVFDSSGTQKVSLLDRVAKNDNKYTFVGAFSMS